MFSGLELILNIGKEKTFKAKFMTNLKRYFFAFPKPAQNDKRIFQFKWQSWKDAQGRAERICLCLSTGTEAYLSRFRSLWNCEKSESNQGGVLLDSENQRTNFFLPLAVLWQPEMRTILKNRWLVLCCSKRQAEDFLWI